MDTFDYILKENKQIKEETTTQINKLKNEITELKNGIDLHFGIRSIIQENIIRNNEDDIEEIDFDSSEANEQLGKHFYQQILNQLLMTINENNKKKFDGNLKKKIIFELCRFALNYELDNKRMSFLINIMGESNTFKKLRDQLIFLLLYKRKLSDEFMHLREEVKYAKIPSDKTRVESSLFSDCPKIKKIYLHENVQSLLDIRSSLPSLEEIVIPYSPATTLDLLGSIYEMNGGKNNNDHFKIKSTIKFLNGTQKIQNIFGDKIEYKKFIKKIILPPSVISIESGSFFNCEFESIKIPPKVTKIPDRCFSGCTKLKKIIIPSSVEIIDEYAFFMCESLLEIELPDSIKEIKNNAFQHSGIEEIKLPKFLIKVEKDTFANCKDLENVEFNENLEEIENDAFCDCDNLSEVDLSICKNIVFEEDSFPSNCEIIPPKKKS